MDNRTTGTSQKLYLGLVGSKACVVFVGLLMLGIPAVATAEGGQRAGDETGLSCARRAGWGVISVVSQHDFATTLERVRAEINTRPLGIFGEVDHQANADSVDMELPPTTTVIFGNPNIGTQLMQANQAIGLELPLKILVREDPCGVVRIEYTKPRALKLRFRIRGLDAVFENIAGVLAAIAAGAAGTD